MYLDRFRKKTERADRHTNGLFRKNLCGNGTGTYTVPQYSYTESRLQRAF